MKKRLFALFLTVAILASMVVIPTYAQDAVTDNVTATTETCPCGCGEDLADITWKPWAGEPKAGHYYLDGNFTQTGTATVLSDTSVVIDLRGQTITTAEPSRLFVVNGFLHVLDTVGGGRMMAKTPDGVGGGVVLVEENEMIGPVFTLHSGTITPDVGSEKANWGGLIGMGNGSTFRMTGGMLLNGHAETAYGGGAIGSKETNATTVEILGGKIVGCSSSKNGGSIYSTGTVKLQNCEIIGGTAGYWGGNVFVSGTEAKLTVKNALIANGISNGTTTGNKYGGGNVIVYSGATATISDSVLRGGYAKTAGGNLCVGKGTTTVTNTIITGGSCGIYGENVYGALSSAKATFTGCTIDGGFHQGLSKLTLKGAMKIGGTGLRLGTGTLTTTGLTSGAEIYVTGDKTFTGTASYFKPAARTAITADGTSLTAVLATDGASGYCPQCDAQVAWTAYGTDGDHSYLTADVTDLACTSINAHTAIDLAGFSITAPGRAFIINTEASLLVTDTAGNGSVTGSGAAGEGGGVFYNFGTLTLQGGTYTYANNADVLIDCGGIIASNGTVNITGCVLDGSAYNNTAENMNGGAIWMADGDTAKLTMAGAYVLGGKAYNGGSVWCGYQNVTNITDSIFLNGSAANNGGNLGAFHEMSTANAGTLNITGCRFEGGKATTYGGNVYIGRCTATLTDCYIAGGEADNYGGNVNVSSSSQIDLEGCIVEGGKAIKGGNMYSPANSSCSTWTGCLVTNGSAETGGNICASNGKTDIIGGEVSYGVATGNGGNVYAGSAKLTGVTIKADAEGNAPLICHGTAATSGGNLYAKNLVTVTDAFIHNGTAATAGNDLYVANIDTTLTLGAGVTGDIRMNANSALLTSSVYGGAISNVTCNAKNATFVMDGGYGECGTILKDSTLYVATTSVVSKGAATWYASNAEAVAACEEGSFVKLYTDNDLVLTKDLYVDLNGHSVAVSGDYAFYGMDTSGDSYAEPAGTVTGVTASTYDITYAPNGNTYVAIANDGSVTYHRLSMKITGVSIRPSADGMYYTAKWSCDDSVKALIDTYGVVASTEDMPDSAFASDEGNLWTTFNQDSFVSGQAQNGAVISGIMKTEDRTAEQNSEYGKKPVYAKAYITFNNGTSVVSNDNIRYSLYDVMKGLDRLIMENPIKYRPFNTTARAFHEKWKDMGMGDWNLDKIPTPADDGVIDVLMIGNSWCYYYVEELYNIAAAAGVDMRVCNVYYSGCPIYNHYNWWKNGESNYQYYETYTDGRKFKGRDVSLEWCLAQREWDVLTMNLGGKEIGLNSVEDILAQQLPMAEELFAYLGESFPNADLYMHQTWARELGYVKTYASGVVRIDTVEDQMAATEKTRQIVNGICAATGVDRINVGDAWELYRAACDEAGIEHNLCARLGNNNNQGDKGHDGDIGGGQYLNACVWFEVLTGLDCRDTTYIPNYTYDGVEYPMSETMAQMLQEAAHTAVTEILPTYPENAN
ncbi:MAG: DUF4886 domain-containing protein [Oscillospiraceae bacterium]|nr:DUF4886 domain-containing protein [Oscillospiraceae bacterium]